jgi:hypothetical protein
VARVAGAGPTERAAITDAPLEQQRANFGLRDPEPRVLPAVNVAEYNESYGGHESDFLLAARQHGLDAKLVGELRDAGIRMAIEAEGRPVSEEGFAVLAKRFSGRINEAQFKALKTWWRSSVEGGA